MLVQAKPLHHTNVVLILIIAFDIDPTLVLFNPVAYGRALDLAIRKVCNHVQLVVSRMN